MQIDFGFQGFNQGSIPPSPIPPDPIPLTFAQVATVNKLLYLPTYYNGPANDGIGATLTASQNGILSDGSSSGKLDYNYTAQIGDVILIKNQTSQLTNGLYEVISTGSPTSPYQLRRSSENDTSSELFPLQVNVLYGQTNTLRYFTQVTSNPTIGTSPLVFAISSQQSLVSPILFVDTATSAPLPTCVYTPGSNASLAGVGATLEASNNGALGSINGLTATTNQNLTTGFYRILVKNQVNAAYNGVYQVTSAGSSTTKWKLTRLAAYASNFYRYTQCFFISNTGSTLAGKYYFTQPQNPPLTNATIGTSPINIVEYGGSGAGGYNLIQDEGSSLPARTTIDFQGAGVTASDDGSKTIVTIPGSNTIIGENYVVVYAGDDWEANATELQNAYNLAQTLTPNGTSISATNRVTVICYPGYYDFKSTFIVDQDYIDLVSTTGECDVRLKCQTSIIAISVRSQNDVLISGIDTQFVSHIFAIEVDTTPNHIFKNCKGGEYSFGAYDNNIFTTKYDVGGTFIDCQGNSSCFGYGTSASGIFTNCVAEDGSFGGGDISLTLQGDATGVFTNCVARNYSFASGGDCTGRFINCQASENSFAFNCKLTSNAYFENCLGTDSCFIKYNSGSSDTIITATFKNCQANDYSFFSEYTGGSNITFEECKGNNYCFGYNGAGPITAITNLYFNCLGNDYCFGYSGVAITSYEINTIKGCKGNDYCFGFKGNAFFNDCQANDYSFTSILPNVMYYTNCSANQSSFGETTGVSAGQIFKYCTAISNSFASVGILSGKLYFCQMRDTVFNTVSGTGRTFYCVGNDIPNNQ